MVKKSEFVKRLLVEVKLRGSYPKRRKAGFSLLEEGVKAVLMRHLPEKKAESSVAALRDGFVDWNEARVSQAQEIATHLRTGSRRGKIERLEEYRAAANDVKVFLQEIFQKTHGLDLETSCEDMVEASKALTDLPTMGQTIGGYILYHAVEGAIPLHKGIMRLCQKLELMGSTTSLIKGLNMIQPIVPKGKEREFVLVMHEVADRWDDDSDPIYMECDVLRTCAFGKKAYKSHVALLARMEAKAIRDEKRRRAQEIRDEAQQRKDEALAERERQRTEAAEKLEAQRLGRVRHRTRMKVQREIERVAKKKQREQDIKDKAIAQKNAEAKKKADAKKALAKKKADAKKALAKKKADAKKALAKKKAEAKKKAADLKKAAAKKATDAKRAVAKKAADAKRAATKKAADAKRAATKKATKKPEAKKEAAPKKR